MVFPRVVTFMVEKAVLIKHDHQKSQIKKTGKLYRLIIKSQKMEAIITELDPHTESRWFKHGGEEFHLVLEGEFEYTVDETTYQLSEGDVLWHPSNKKHRARNSSDTKVKYITIGTPPTFALEML